MNRSPLSAILERIQQASTKASREQSVKLLAVTKKQSKQAIEQLLQDWAKHHDTPICLGENYVQELVKRRKEFPVRENIEWHLIGPLQSNKVRLAVENADVIQSIHSEKIAGLVHDEAQRIQKSQRIFVQVNISCDSKKSGVQEREVLGLLRYILANCPALKLEGLMTITEHFDNPQLTKQDFAAMHALRQSLSTALKMPLVLSMGMSSDFELAIEEGADMVRVGTALFGERSL
jgi:pyridoxal phosphate enzyme (YggS family)